MEPISYVDLSNGERETLFFFLLNAYLQSRIETDCESNGDEEVNVYIAGLLESLVDGTFYATHADVLATSAVDVTQRAQERNTDRDKAQVYRSNADHRFIAFGLFDGWGEYQSRHRLETTPRESYLKEAQQLYAWAALFCARMPKRYHGLAQTLEKMTEGFDTYLGVLNHMASNHLDFLPRLSVGEAFHLERSAHQASLPKIEEYALDLMLDAYNRWRSAPSEQTRQDFLQQSAPYRELRRDFDPPALLN
ncbi:MAG: hypothetical protein VX733_07600 [Candidatus Latescibacterota bacterium]|nr:hypothetical protein [Candidatus Latescibacterota bacterium]